MMQASRRCFLSTAAAPLAALAAVERPNIVFVLLDDLGWKDFGCYGNTFHETPNIDRLAREGVRFAQAYAACPVCSPTRASIMTGKYPARLHLTDWIPGRKQWPTAKLLTPPFEQQLPLEETNVAEALGQLGYRSAIIGKWHLGGGDYLPERQGFERNVGAGANGGVRSFFGPFNLVNLQGGSRDEYLNERLTSAAEEWLGEAAGQGPFLLYLAEYLTHTPIQAPEPLVEKYRRKGASEAAEANPIYAAMIERVDQMVGRVRARLEQAGVAGRTVIIVTSDNGGLRYEGRSPRPVTDNSPLRAGKGHLYEGGIRVPLLVYWPGLTKPGRAVDTPVSSIDFLPTLVEMAGARAPSGLDGISLAPLLRGGSPPRRDALYWHYPHYSNQGGVPSGAIRQGDWKLIEFYEDGRLELFHLKDDPGEKQNLVNREPARARRMHAALRRWRDSVKAAMPQVNPNYDPAKADQELTGKELPTHPNA
jgi:arylsulfatase A-like enzyme